ncbi:MAG: class I SAM-dependent methyltransferase [Acidimicrobiaceae bacterium]|nr:class I SAM-dependent methyltransferase [Acidimicrobiaceae bacterium]
MSSAGETSQVPALVRAAYERARSGGFELSCEREVGRFLAVLAAALPPGGRVLELGTGAGVGLAWLVHGVGTRADVSVTSVESDPEAARLAEAGRWPPFVRLELADAVEFLGRRDRYDLIFADAQGGKWEALDRTISALEPGGILVVDDMTPPDFGSDEHRQKTAEVRAHLLGEKRLVSAELAFSSGVIASVRRREEP